MEKKILSDTKRKLIIELGEMIKNASDQEIVMLYGLLMGISISKEK